MVASTKARRGARGDHEVIDRKEAHAEATTKGGHMSTRNRGDAHVDEDGNTVPAKPSTLTLDYARLMCCLWQANRSMLARLEALEARLQ